MLEKKIKVGIVGYGNLGRGVELALRHHPEMELVGVFSRRSPESLTTAYPETKKESLDDILSYKDKIDCLILCGGSKDDLPTQSPFLAEHFNIIDSYDTHNSINPYFDRLDPILKQNQHTGIISTGWDPGLFSLNRLLFSSILPQGVNYTFWGKGVSQGHSDAIRRIPGVKKAIQYTVPVDTVLDEIRQGSTKKYDIAQKHHRLCYVVSDDPSLNDEIARKIKTMPDYFADYHTEVTFISEEAFLANHLSMPHGGLVIHNAETEDGHKQRMEFSLQLDSNPEFTASVLVAYTKALYRLSQEGNYGCKTIFDIPISYLSTKSNDELRKVFL